MDLITKIAKKHGIHIETVQKKGRAAYLINDADQKKYFIKLQPPCGSFLSGIVRALCGGSLPFMNEYLMNNKMLSIKSKDVFFPPMLYGCPGEYIVFEYIGCTELIRADEVQKLSAWIESGLLSFNSMLTVKGGSFIGKIIFSLMESPILRILRQLGNNEFSLNTKLRVFKLMFMFYLKQRGLKAILIHNDLSFSNLMSTKGGRLLLIDFEDSIAENKMVLTDAVDLMFDREKLLLPIAKVENYWQKLSDKLGIGFNSLNFKLQIRVCVLRYLLNSIFNPDFSIADQKKYHQFMMDNVLDERGFSDWFEKNNVII